MNTEPTFTQRVNAEAEKAREAILILEDILRDLAGAPWITHDAKIELDTSWRHLENARLRILDFARQEAD